MTTPTPLEKLLLKLEGNLPEDLLEEVSDFLYEQEEAIKEKEGEVTRLEEIEEQFTNPSFSDLAEQVGNLTEEGKQKFLTTFLLEWSNEYAFLSHFKDHYPELQFQEDYLYITIPLTPDGMLPIQVEKLEEYINQHGVDSTLERLTQDYSREVEELEQRVTDLETEYDNIQDELTEANNQLEEAREELTNG